jgi:hypothetical protein
VITLYWWTPLVWFAFTGLSVWRLINTIYWWQRRNQELWKDNCKMYQLNHDMMKLNEDLMAACADLMIEKLDRES